MVGRVTEAAWVEGGWILSCPSEQSLVKADSTYQSDYDAEQLENADLWQAYPLPVLQDP